MTDHTAGGRPSDADMTIHLVPHFHVDPVWWNTQSASIDQLDAFDWSASPRMLFQRSALDILLAHLQLADGDADYRFCVAEVDYLEPFWYHHPHERDRFRRLLDAGRVEVVGATYNEPSTNLTSLELTRRNLIHGLRFQRGVLGATAEIAWQVDVFGHDPSVPAVLADAGVVAVVFARGPFRPWGPMLLGGFDTPKAPEGRQFPSEFEWIAPDGRSLLGVYLAGHYSTGYAVDAEPALDDAERFVTAFADKLRTVSSTDHVIVPVGTDIGPPARWINELARRPIGAPDRPRIVTSTPTDAIGAIARALGSSDGPSPQTRDMNPIYTGKDVSYIDTKQAHRAAEHLLADAEQWATLSWLVAGQPYPAAAIEDSWRLLVYAAHHDAITGTESDQVYVDLLAGWRQAHDLALGVRRSSQRAIAAVTDTRHPDTRHPDDRLPTIAIIVHSGTCGRRTDVVEFVLDDEVLAPLAAIGLRVLDGDGSEVDFVTEHHQRHEDGTLRSATVSMVVEVEGIGRRTFHVTPGPDLPQWTTSSRSEPCSISNRWHTVTVDPERGGCVSSWTDPDGAERITSGRVANEIVRYHEYADHPRHGEGPWHLLPDGPGIGTATEAAGVDVLTSPIGERLVIRGRVPAHGDGSPTYVSTLTLWADIDRVDGSVTVHDIDGADHLLRLRWPVAVRGALPVFESAGAVIGRGFALIEVDAQDHPWTLDTPAHGWFGSSVTARIRIQSTGGVSGGMSGGMSGRVTERAIGVAEVIVADAGSYGEARSLLIALAASGVTATTTTADDIRYGSLALDSNAPDVRIVVGVVGGDAHVDSRLERLAPSDRRRLEAQLERSGQGRAWRPARRPLRDVWVPGLDVRGDDDLPTLLVVGADRASVAAELAAVVGELAGSTISVPYTGHLDVWCRDEQPESRSVAICNRGTPGSAVDTDGTLHVSLLRASSGWPSGQWIDPPHRCLPDGGGFQTQRWTHRFEYALLSRPGDWRAGGFVRTALEFQRPLVAVVESVHEGDLPPIGALLDVVGDGVEVDAFHRVIDGADEGADVVLRMSEVHGRPAVATVVLPVAVERSWDASLLGKAMTPPTAGPPAPTFAPYRTITSRLAVGPAITPPAASRDTAELACSRWWAQGRGPRTTDVGPVALHLHPPTVGPDRRWTATLARVVEHLDAAADARSVDVELVVDAPDGWIGRRDPIRLRLEPGAYSVVPLDVVVPTVPVAGHHLVRVTARCRPSDGEGGHHTVYDERHVPIAVTDPLASFAGNAPAVVVAAGASTVAHWSLRNNADVALHAVVDFVSPWGTWESIRTHRLPAVLAARSITTLEVPVEVAPTTHGGRWWWMARASIGPCVIYSDTAPFEILDRSDARP